MSLLKDKDSQRVVLENLYVSRLKSEKEAFAKSDLTTQHVLLGLDEIDLENLRRLLENRWDDPSVFDGMRTIFSSLSMIEEELQAPVVYRHYLRILKILGEG